jgi:anion-transporting  ArsA/GET3 family ATPase
MSLLDRRILLVTGKGGVGRSNVCAALGLAAAAGQKTLIAEVAANTRTAEVFGLLSLGYEATALARNLYGLSITPEAAIEDSVVRTIKVRTLFKLAFQNWVMVPFMDAVPGMHDAVQPV